MGRIIKRKECLFPLDFCLSPVYLACKELIRRAIYSPLDMPQGLQRGSVFMGTVWSAAKPPQGAK